MRVLVISPYLPHRQIGHGGGVSIREMVRHLSRLHDVTLVSLMRRGEEAYLDEVAQSLDVTLHPIPFLDRRAVGRSRTALLIDRFRAGLRSLGTGYPLYVEKYWSPDLSRRIQAAVAQASPDVVQVEYLQLARILQDLRRWRDRVDTSGAKLPRLILDTHEMGSLPRSRRAEMAGNPLSRKQLQLSATRWRKLERDATRWADYTLCVTDQDRKLLEASGGINCVTVPLGIDTEAIKPVWEKQGPGRLLFVGSFDHGPNRSAAKFLVDRVWPVVAQYTSMKQLVLAGRGSDRFISALGIDDDSVVGLGFVDDLTELYRSCRLCVAPLNQGGGIKIKILEAMAHGIPVVTTPVGAEGIVAEEDDAMTLAAADESFATAVVEALEDRSNTIGRARRARMIIENRFSWSAITERLTSLYGRR